MNRSRGTAGLKVALLKPEAGRGVLPYALLALAAAVRRAGGEPRLFHSGRWARDVDAAAAWGAELAAVSALTGPNLVPAIRSLVALKLAGIATVLGGVHPTLMPELALETGADFIVVGEGEVPLEHLARSRRADDDATVPGLGFVRGDEVALNPRPPLVAPDDYPLPWELVELDRYLYRGADGKRTFPLITSRDCPETRGLCIAPATAPGRRRPYSLECLAAAKREIERRVRPEAIQFFDASFLDDRARAEDLIALWSLPWQAGARAGRVDAAFAAWAKHSRCQRLFLGAESGSDRIFGLFDRQATVAQAEAAVAALAAAAIPVELSFTVGFPGESGAERNATLDFMDRLQRLHPGATATVTVYTPYPGTPLWPAALAAGFRAPETNEAWARFGRAWAGLPWLDPAVAAQLALCSRHAGCRAADLRPPGYALYRPLAEWRWRGRRFGFPLEARLQRLLTNG